MTDEAIGEDVAVRPGEGRAILVGIIETLWTIRWWVGGLLATIALASALKPSVAWITQSVLASVTSIDRETMLALAISWGPIYLLISGAETILKFLSKFLEKMVDVRLVIILQRLYLSRRVAEVEGRDVSQLLFGCRVALKGFDLVYKNAWKIVTQVVSVLVWQLTLGPEWLLLMALSVFLPAVFVWKIGPAIQTFSRRILAHHEDMASNTSSGRLDRFEAAQEAWMKSSIRFEILKWIAEEAMSVLMWISLVALVYLAYVFDLGLVPATIELAAAAAFVVNLRLVSGPVTEISKTYAKWREAHPAVRKVLLGV